MIYYLTVVLFLGGSDPSPGGYGSSSTFVHKYNSSLDCENAKAQITASVKSRYKVQVVLAECTKNREGA